ncbi:MAG: hypothetical protein P1U46_00800 [Patescibacteria group bacterium]|nr:hypothetical protein [Patescibacteria group bacterium]
MSDQTVFEVKTEPKISNCFLSKILLISQDNISVQSKLSKLPSAISIASIFVTDGSTYIFQPFQVSLSLVATITSIELLSSLLYIFDFIYTLAFFAKSVFFQEISTLSDISSIIIFFH